MSKSFMTPLETIIIFSFHMDSLKNNKSMTFFF